MAQYTIHEAKTHLSRLLREAANGVEVVIVNRDRPVAKLVALQPPRRNLGFLAGQITIADDFDAPLDDFKDYTQ